MVWMLRDSPFRPGRDKSEPSRANRKWAVETPFAFAQGKQGKRDVDVNEHREISKNEEFAEQRG